MRTIEQTVYTLTELKEKFPSGYKRAYENYEPGFLKIGCELHKINEWPKMFPAIAKKYNLTDKEKTEYKSIINLFVKIGV